jgi:serine/threonine protein kinase
MQANPPTVRSIFLAAVENYAPEQWPAYLDEACAGESALRRRVVALLQGHALANSLLDAPESSSAVACDEQTSERPGAMIGPYKLLEQIGEGGMGLVFVAEQQRPVRRRVALKIIKPGMDSQQVVARFEAERQALAMMDHPNIAKVLDGGAIGAEPRTSISEPRALASGLADPLANASGSAGRPYFVMELVKGKPITEYCDKHRLPTRQRLELFLDVCHAVQHAHLKGIIHRDLKPSNILVEIHDVRPVVKVIDFGIAKATGRLLTDKTLYTSISQLVGTPLYMSPEQAGLSSLDVDTRSDVYSLGVLLYELLTGTTPFDSEALKRAGYDEMRRIIREEEPPKPSTRISTIQQAHLSTIAEQRGLEPRSLREHLRGELDWIVMKALEKDRDHRYESASAFAADVQRCLNDEAVEACPPSAGYKLRKYVRRNRRVLVPLAVIAMVLVAATTVSAWLAVHALDAQHQAEADRKQAELDRDLAREAERQAVAARTRAKAAEGQAATDSAIARAVNNFLQNDLLRQVNSDPQFRDEISGNTDLTVKEALDRAAAKIDERFKDQPLVQAAIRTAIGEAYISVGRPQLAISHFENAVTLYRASRGPNHPDTLASMQRLARNYAGWLGRSREAIVILETVVEENTRLFGRDHATSLDSLRNLADAYRHSGLWDRAIQLASKVLEKRTEMVGPTHTDTVDAVHQLAMIYLDAGLLAESLSLHEKVLAIHEAKQESNYWAMKSYARALQAAGKLEEADRQLRKTLELHRKLSDRRAREWGITGVHAILAVNLLQQERYTEAEPVAGQILTMFEKENRYDWQRFHGMSLIGGALLGQQKYAEAESFLVQGYEGMKEREVVMGAGFSKYWLTKAGDRLIRFYEITNQPEKARAWREKIGVGAEVRTSPDIEKSKPELLPLPQEAP